MTEHDPGTVSKLLLDWRGGDADALERLMPLVYDEMHRIAESLMRGERKGHTLQTTALVHEAYVRLVDRDISLNDRVHFLSLAASTMRRILVDHARARRRDKRGGAAVRVTLDEALTVSDEPPERLLDIDAALRRLEEKDPRKAKALEMHLFGGLTHAEIGALFDVSVSTVERDMRLARAWLRSELSDR
ncbi:MAG: sigma-70 family RNA polymerase sigma factor [Acidobacteriota bacterium]|nr:sigma-70 family RNA polymerase sigma factor [Acidobacteriota bacterium]